MSILKCKLWFHDWSKWVQRSGTITIRNPIFQTLDRIPAVWQERACKDCGKLQRKT